MQTALTFAHFFIPRHSNNHRAKLIHTPSLFLISMILVVYQLFVSIFVPANTVKTLGYAANISADEVIRLTNEKRAQAGLAALRYNSSLTQAAQAKARHMIDNDYWAHVAPDGTEPWKFFTDFGYRYRYAGENLARDFSGPSAVVDAWMASPSHRDNLMSNKYVDIGIGITEGDLSGADATIVVQLFGTPLSGDTAAVPAKAAAIATATPTRRLQPTAAPTFTVTPAPTLVPTSLVPSPLPTVPGEGGVILTTLPPAEKEASKFTVLISPFTSTRGVSLIVTGLLIIVFFIDALVIFRKRIARNHGRTLAHLSFLGAILAIILIARTGQIL